MLFIVARLQLGSGFHDLLKAKKVHLEFVLSGKSLSASLAVEGPLSRVSSDMSV